MNRKQSWVKVTKVAVASLSMVAYTAAPFFAVIPSVAFADTTAALSAVSEGNYTSWTANTGTKTDAVSMDDGDTTYISATDNNARQSFVVSNAGVPSDAIINSVTLGIVAKESGGDASIKLLVENGTNGSNRNTDSSRGLTASYTTYNRSMTTNPLTNTAWTAAEVNAWTVRFGVEKSNSQTSRIPRVSKVSVVVDYTIPALNPSLPTSCGLDVALVMDSSGSVDTTELGQMKFALNAFVSAFLPATPTQFSVTDFGDTASVLQTFTGNTASLTTAINTPTSGGYTNWEDGLLKAQSTFDPRGDHPNLVIFASDGNPNRTGNPAVSASESVALDAAVTVANSLKSSGTRIITLGIGDQLDVANLEAISSADAVYTSNFSTLATDLAALASELCGGTITVTKLIDADSNLETAGDRSPASGWTFTTNGSDYVTDISGQTQAVELNQGTYSAAESVQSAYELLTASCSGATSNGSFSGNAVSGIEVGSSDIVSCTFINGANQMPVITVTGDNPLELVVNVGSYAEQGATADDAEDGSGLTVTDINSSAVNTSAVGSYSVTYNFTDSDGTAAAEATREVQVKTACTDGIDNDSDGQTDDADSGCVVDDPTDNDENSTPEIELIGLSLVSVPAGNSYSEQGAMAHDNEDGDNPAVVGGDTVNTNVPGDYIVTYNYTDTGGLSATEVTRTVTVTSYPQCSDDADNDEDQLIDSADPACHTDKDASNSESYDPNLNDESADPVVDVCPNLEGTQSTVPSGYHLSEGQCVLDTPPVTDVCPNIEGTQESVPSGYHLSDGQCVADSTNGSGGGTPTDVCPNIDGTQESVPSGYHLSGGQCVRNSVGGGFPIGGGGGGTPAPAGIVLGATTGQVLGATSCNEEYIRSYIKYGVLNNLEDVLRLQVFLNDTEGEHLAVTGVYDLATRAAVERFQVKYGSEVLQPWVSEGLLPDIMTPTGYVYKTTKRWINLLNCPALGLPVPNLSGEGGVGYAPSASGEKGVVAGVSIAEAQTLGDTTIPAGTDDATGTNESGGGSTTLLIVIALIILTGGAWFGFRGKKTV